MRNQQFAHHTLEIRHNHDLYRHLYCTQPDTTTHHFEIITSPGVLVFHGDVKHALVFRYDTDVLPLFRGAYQNNEPNYTYLAHKTAGQWDTIREYRRSLMVENIHRDALAAIDIDTQNDLEGILEHIADNLLPDLIGHETHDRETVQNFSYEWFTFDISEWNIYTLTNEFKYACDAIAWAIEQYDNAVALIH